MICCIDHVSDVGITFILTCRLGKEIFVIFVGIFNFDKLVSNGGQPLPQREHPIPCDWAEIGVTVPS